MVFETIKDLIVKQLSVAEDRVTKDARLAEDLGADSIDAVELIMEIETAFNIEVSDEEAQSVKTVGDLCEYVEKHK
ncbi:MAG: acyl carrier protein [Acholeplasmataceae bacterium]